MITLGICNDESASACLFEDGHLVAAVSEERFSRKKLDNSFPFKSIEYVLSHSSYNIDDINVAYSWTKGFDPDLLKYYMNRFSQCQTEEERSILQERIDFDIVRDTSNKNEFFEWYRGNSLDHYYHHELIWFLHYDCYYHYHYHYHHYYYHYYYYHYYYYLIASRIPPGQGSKQLGAKSMA